MAQGLGRSYRSAASRGDQRDSLVPFTVGFEGATGFAETQEGAKEDLPEVMVPAEEKDLKGVLLDDNYSQIASFVDQLQKHPTTCKFGPVQYEFFSLPADLERLNAFRARAFPPEAPQIAVIGEQPPQWNSENNSYQLLLRYHNVYYRKLAA
jgi:hypothetical protein